MKTIPMVPACQNMEELHKLTDLICECIHPQMVILFGYYAGMDFHNALKGYEMLVITEEKPMITVRELVGLSGSVLPYRLLIGGPSVLVGNLIPDEVPPISEALIRTRRVR